MSVARRLGWIGLAATILSGAVALAVWGPDAGLRWGLIRSLHQLGLGQVHIGGATLSMSQGAIRIESLDAGPGLGLGGLTLTFGWKPLLDRRLSVERLEVSGLTLTVRDEAGTLVVEGLPIPTANQGGTSDWGVELSGMVISDSVISFRRNGLVHAFALERLEVGAASSAAPDMPTPLKLKGALAGGQVVLDGAVQLAADGPRWDGRLTLQGMDTGMLSAFAGLDAIKGRLDADLLVKTAGMAGTAEGTAALSGLAAPLPEGNATAHKAVFKGKAAWGKSPQITGSFSADGVAIDHRDISVQASEAGWTGSLVLADTPKAEGTLTLKSLNLKSGQIAATARHARISATAEARRGQEGPPAATLQGSELTAEALTVQDGDTRLLKADSLSATNLGLAGEGPLTVERLILAGAQGLDGARRPRAEARRVTVSRLEVATDGAVAADSLRLSGATLRLSRTKDGWAGFANKGSGDDGLPRVQIARISADDGRIDFFDRLPPSPVRLTAQGIAATLTGLDTTRPAKDNAFALKGRIGEGAFQVSGLIRPFAAKPTGKIEGSVRTLELPPLSPYLAQALGVNLQTGQLDADIQAKADSGRLDGVLKLDLAQVFVERPQTQTADPAQADLPIETILELLRDSGNKISLTLPVKGDMTNPEFDTSDAVGQAIGSALTGTLMTTLKVAFPVLALIDLITDEADNPRVALEPLRFPAGESELGEHMTDHLGAVAKLMTAHPKLAVRLCGVADAQSDWPVLRQKSSIVARLKRLAGKPESAPPNDRMLERLAEERALAAKQFLADKGGIEAGRLFVCRPEIGSGSVVKLRF